MQIVLWKLWSVQYYPREEFALLRHQSNSCTSLRMSVSLFHIPVTSRVVQLLKGYDLVFWNFFFFWCLISFVPQGLSGMGWLHTENVHAQHARDHSRFSPIPVMEKKKPHRNIYIQRASMPKMLRTSLSAHSVRLPPCVSAYLCACALQISVLVRLLFVILFCASVCV